MSLETIELWHRRARPEPTDHDFQVQLGCHLEEVLEMLGVIGIRGDDPKFDQWLQLLRTAFEALEELADALKQGRLRVEIMDRKQLLDALADQIVTAIGVGHCAEMRTAEAVVRVNTSNWTKFGQDGMPIRDANGKIAKGPGYQPPNLEGCY